MNRTLIDLSSRQTVVPQPQETRSPLDAFLETDWNRTIGRDQHSVHTGVPAVYRPHDGDRSSDGSFTDLEYGSRSRQPRRESDHSESTRRHRDVEQSSYDFPDYSMLFNRPRQTSRSSRRRSRSRSRSRSRRSRSHSPRFRSRSRSRKRSRIRSRSRGSPHIRERSSRTSRERATDQASYDKFFETTNYFGQRSEPRISDAERIFLERNSARGRKRNGSSDSDRSSSPEKRRSRSHSHDSRKYARESRQEDVHRARQDVSRERPDIYRARPDVGREKPDVSRNATNALESEMLQFAATSMLNDRNKAVDSSRSDFSWKKQQPAQNERYLWSSDKHVDELPPPGSSRDGNRTHSMSSTRQLLPPSRQMLPSTNEMLDHFGISQNPYPDVRNIPIFDTVESSVNLDEYTRGVVIIPGISGADMQVLRDIFNDIVTDPFLKPEFRVKNMFIAMTKHSMNRNIDPDLSIMALQTFSDELVRTFREDGWNLSYETAMKISFNDSQHWFSCDKCNINYPPSKFSCKVCPELFTVVEDLLVHEARCHRMVKGGNFKCEYCDLVFPLNPEALRNHVYDHHICVEDHYRCPHACRDLIPVYDRSSVEKHVDLVHYCVICNDKILLPILEHEAVFHSQHINMPKHDPPITRSFVKIVSQIDRKQTKRFKDGFISDVSGASLPKPYSQQGSSNTSLTLSSKSQVPIMPPPAFPMFPPPMMPPAVMTNFASFLQSTSGKSTKPAALGKGV